MGCVRELPSNRRTSYILKTFRMTSKVKTRDIPCHSIFTAVLVPGELCQQGFLSATWPTGRAFLPN